MNSSEKLPTVSSVDISKYMGDWYVIANMPLPLEGDLVNSIESYTWNEKENRIDVNYRGYKKTPQGELKEYPQKAFIHNKQTNAEWRVQFFWPLKFPYLILELAPDYSYTIVGVPNRKYVWIMARKPSMDDATYAKMIEKLVSLGYDTSKVQKVLQSWPEQSSSVQQPHLDSQI